MVKGCACGVTSAVAAAGAFCDPGNAQAKPNIEELSRRVQTELDHLWIEKGFPGTTAAFVLPGGSTRCFAAGMADREARNPMKPDARMLSGSTGKSFVAAVSVRYLFTPPSPFRRARSSPEGHG